jgi:hypothetical protein
MAGLWNIMPQSRRPSGLPAGANEDSAFRATDAEDWDQEVGPGSRAK